MCVGRFIRSSSPIIEFLLSDASDPRYDVGPIGCKRIVHAQLLYCMSSKEEMALWLQAAYQ